MQDKKHDLLSELQKHWANAVFDKSNCECCKNFVAKCDQDCLKDVYKLSYFYRTHLLPQPYWGNIVDPKVIVLSLNPSYDVEKDEYDEAYIKEDLSNFLNGKIERFNWLKYKNSETDNKKTTSGYKFWSMVLKGFKYETNSDEIAAKVGFFNLVGYRSRSYETLPSTIFIDNKDKLTTQEILISYLNELIKTVSYVVVIWGRKKWEAAGLKLDRVRSDKLIVCNNANYRNKNISNAIKRIIDEDINKNDLLKDFTEIFGKPVNNK